MFMARRKPSHSQLTLRRRYDFHIGEAIRASLAGSWDKAAAHSETALAISRELYREACDDHRPELAAALACHAGSSAAYGRIGDAVALLTESAGHYAALAAADPEAYEVRRLDVLTHVALASDATGNSCGAIALLREVVQMYGGAPAETEAEREFGRARARFHLGRCLLKAGDRDAALGAIDAGLTDAERAWTRLRTDSPDDVCPPDDVCAGSTGAGDVAGADDAGPAVSGSWLAIAPRSVQAIAPDWAAAAVRAMALHAAAGRWHPAARAARVAVRLSAGLAALGGDGQRESYAAIRARADAIRARARQEQPRRARAATTEGVLRRVRLARRRRIACGRPRSRPPRRHGRPI